MVRRVFYTGLALLLSVAAFCGADPIADVNLFGVLFLIFAFVVWFHWGEIEAGYAFLEENRQSGNPPSSLMFVRFAPMLLREFLGKKSKSRRA